MNDETGPSERRAIEIAGNYNGPSRRGVLILIGRSMDADEPARISHLAKELNTTPGEVRATIASLVKDGDLEGGDHGFYGIPEPRETGW